MKAQPSRITEGTGTRREAQQIIGDVQQRGVERGVSAQHRGADRDADIGHVAAHGLKKIDAFVSGRRPEQRNDEECREPAEQEHAEGQAKRQKDAFGIHARAGIQDGAEQIKGQDDFDHDVRHRGGTLLRKHLRLAADEARENADENDRDLMQRSRHASPSNVNHVFIIMKNRELKSGEFAFLSANSITWRL